jgi:hypothetical protein
MRGSGQDPADDQPGRDRRPPPCPRVGKRLRTRTTRTQRRGEPHSRLDFTGWPQPAPGAPRNRHSKRRRNPDRAQWRRSPYDDPLTQRPLAAHYARRRLQPLPMWCAQPTTKPGRGLLAGLAAGHHFLRSAAARSGDAGRLATPNFQRSRIRGRAPTQPHIKLDRRFSCALAGSSNCSEASVRAMAMARSSADSR